MDGDSAEQRFCSIPLMYLVYIFLSVSSFGSNSNMLPWSFVCLQWMLATPGAFAGAFRGTFVPPETTSSLVEGDIAVPETYDGTGLVLGAFLANQSALWPRAFIPYRIETFEWNGKVEPIFLDDQIENITQSLTKIMTDVPCLKFQ